MSERQDPHPFKEPFRSGSINLENTMGGPSLIREFESNRERVVRVHQLDSKYLPQAPNRETARQFWVEKSAELIRKTESCLAQFSKYVAVPKHEFVLGNNSPAMPNPTIFTVTDRVHGRPLEEEVAAADSALTNDELRSLFKNLIGYFKDSFYAGNDILSDAAHIKQYMYGTTASDPNAKIYMVDLDTITTDSHGDQARLTGPMAQSLSSLELMMQIAGESRSVDFETEFKDELELT